MRRLLAPLSAALFLLATVPAAFAFVTDGIYFHGVLQRRMPLKPAEENLRDMQEFHHYGRRSFLTGGYKDIEQQKKDAKEAAREEAWLEGTIQGIRKKISKEFPCLRLLSNSDVRAKLRVLRAQALVGPGGSVDASNKMTADEEAWLTEGIQANMQSLGDIMAGKYYFHVIVVPKPLVNVMIAGYNRKQAKGGPFYAENKIYPSIEEALADVDRIGEDIVQALVERASQDKWNNEVCPLLGKVEVKVSTDRKQDARLTFPEHCNNADFTGEITNSLTGEGRQVWTLERIGNPDATGTVEATLHERLVREELENCYDCPGGEKTRRALHVETDTKARAAELASTTFVSDGRGGFNPDNKAAAIRLHFSPDGQYRVSVRAVSVEGVKEVVKTRTATGACQETLKPVPPEKRKMAFPLEKTFGPFAGTLKDRKLKDHQKLPVKDEKTGETTVYEIDFELHRP